RAAQQDAVAARRDPADRLAHPRVEPEREGPARRVDHAVQADELVYPDRSHSSSSLTSPCWLPVLNSRVGRRAAGPCWLPRHRAASLPSCTVRPPASKAFGASTWYTAPALVVRDSSRSY